MENTQLNMLHIILDSGPVVKFVLLLLVVCSVYSWAIIFNKRKKLKKVKYENRKFLTEFENSQDKSLGELARSISDYDHSTVVLMFDEGYEELKRMQKVFHNDGLQDKFQSFFTGHGLDALDRSLKKGVNKANHVLELRLANLASIGSIAPFIGLFGTVWGIINSFTGLAQGGGSIEAVAPGIAEALVATAVGLAAAIPAVWAYNLFSNSIGELNNEMENFGQDFINYVERQVWSGKE